MIGTFKTRRVITAFVAPLLVLLGMTVAAEKLPPSTQPAARVTIDNFTFSPHTLTVQRRTKVTWVNHDDVPHTVTSASKPRVLDSRAMDSDDTFSFVFEKPGTYSYYCAV